MNIAVLTTVGHYRVARRFLDFILDVIPYKDEKIQIMYGINGKKNLTEKILPGLQGYEDSKPVRIGNDAYKQKQNDIFGVLLDVIYQYLKIFKRDTVENREDLWTVVRTLGRHVERNWMKKDRGIWEIRGRKKHFTFSKVLCWVAMDRAMKIARAVFHGQLCARVGRHAPENSQRHFKKRLGRGGQRLCSGLW